MLRRIKNFLRTFASKSEREQAEEILEGNLIEHDLIEESEEDGGKSVLTKKTRSVSGAPKKRVPVKKKSLGDNKMNIISVFTARKKFKLLYEKNGHVYLRDFDSVNGSGGVRLNFINKKGEADKIVEVNKLKFAQFGQSSLLSGFREGKTGAEAVFFSSRDLINWREISSSDKIKRETIFVSGSRASGSYVAYTGENFIYPVVSKNLRLWSVKKDYILTPRQHCFDSFGIKLIGTVIVESGILLLYESSYRLNDYFHLQVGGVLLDANNPSKVLWRADVPVWEQNFKSEEVQSCRSVGLEMKNKRISLYYTINGELKLVTFGLPMFGSANKSVFKLDRYIKNPIMEPRAEHGWENEAVFNPAAYFDGQKVHLLYRAVGINGISSLGYAKSGDGLNVEYRSKKPAYMPRESFEGINTKPSDVTDLYKSGAGWGGCEDPKITVIEEEGMVYLTYVAYDGYRPPRVAISSIAKDDFINKRWENWVLPQLMSRPGIIDKSACLLPEKHKGKYVMYHRVFPNILIDFLDELDFGDGKWLKNQYKISPRATHWDSRKLSVGATPIRIDEGWLVIYHAVDDRDDSKYQVGAMIIDADDPTKVLYRTSNPILSPDMPYENDSKPGVAYPCGAAVVGDNLFVYYGGGDKVVCVATSPLKKLVKHLIQKSNVNPALETVPLS